MNSWSFLLFYLIEDKYIEVQEKIYQVITKTLAYSLADKEEQQKLIQMVDILGNYLMQIIETPEKRYRYSKSLLGVQKEIEIENWVKEHIENLIISMSSEEIFDIIFPLLMKEESKIAERCKNYDDLKGKRLNFRHGYKNPRPHFCNRSTLIIHI